MAGRELEEGLPGSSRSVVTCGGSVGTCMIRPDDKLLQVRNTAHGCAVLIGWRAAGGIQAAAAASERDEVRSTVVHAPGWVLWAANGGGA